MSDLMTKELSKVVGRIEFSRLNASTVHEVKRRIIDSIACLYAGFDEEVSQISRTFSQNYRMESGATLIGTSTKVPSEIAGFANGTAIRSLDFNDTYLSKEPQHPSDVIAPLLALAEENSIDMQRLIAAVALAYEVSVLFCDSASLKANGWDHVNYITVATVVGGAYLLELSEDETEQALALAVVPHAAMRQSRNGEISMWKGAAAANAARNAVFALKLAKSGMKGPYEPFAGSMAFNELLLHGALDIPKAAEQIRAIEHPVRILQTYIKNWAVEYMAQVGIEAVFALRGEIRHMDDILKVTIDTFQLAYDILAKDREKWSPKTRETADHSMPYIIMAALEDGKIDLDTFAAERISNPDTIRRIQNMMTIKVNDELTAEYPDGNPTVLTIELKDGSVLQKKVKYPTGHVGKPMSDQELNVKFHACTGGILDRSQQEQMLAMLWDLEQVTDYQQLTSLFIVRR